MIRRTSRAGSLSSTHGSGVRLESQHLPVRPRPMFFAEDSGLSVTTPSLWVRCTVSARHRDWAGACPTLFPWCCWPSSHSTARNRERNSVAICSSTHCVGASEEAVRSALGRSRSTLSTTRLSPSTSTSTFTSLKEIGSGENSVTSAEPLASRPELDPDDDGSRRQSRRFSLTCTIGV